MDHDDNELPVLEAVACELHTHQVNIRHIEDVIRTGYLKEWNSENLYTRQLMEARVRMAEFCLRYSDDQMALICLELDRLRSVGKISKL